MWRWKFLDEGLLMTGLFRRCRVVQRQDLAHFLCLAVMLILLLAWGMTRPEKFVQDDDEGMNLMKAQSVRAGYKLYEDIWSDQPPLFTLLLAMAFGAFGPSVSAGRMLVLGFALLALLSTALISRHVASSVGSLASVLFLATTDRFTSLALSIRIDLPAISLVSLAVLFTLRYLRTNRRVWLLLTGIAFFSALMIKPMGAYLAVAIALALYLCAQQTASHRWRRLACDVGLLIGIGAAILAICFALFDVPSLIDQILGTELRSQQFYSLREADTLERFRTYLRDAGWPYWGLLAVAAWGALSLRSVRRKPEVLLVLAMLLCTVGILMLRVPLRRRYLVLFSVPLSVLGGVAVDDLIRRLRDPKAAVLQRGVSLCLGVALVTAALAGVGWRINHLLSSVPGRDWRGEDAVQFIVQNTSPESYIICDEGMITFRSGRRSPPSLSVLSDRRIRTGGLTAEELIATTQVYRPEAIVLWEAKLSDVPEYIDWVEAHYHRARMYDDRHQIFLLSPAQGQLR